MGSGEGILAKNEPNGKAGPFPKRVGNASRWLRAEVCAGFIEKTIPGQ
jgi:hypothetical protein